MWASGLSRHRATLTIFGRAAPEIGIARAFGVQPSFIIADEPVSGPGRVHSSPDPQPADDLKDDSTSPICSSPTTCRCTHISTR